MVVYSFRWKGMQLGIYYVGTSEATIKITHVLYCSFTYMEFKLKVSVACGR